ncbi:hypothetical protein [Fructobacillus tropaeoli]|nr:hypothetical protein [Fructobacillus tropaeoli]
MESVLRQFSEELSQKIDKQVRDNQGRVFAGNFNLNNNHINN